jgi:hypothetical protein
MKNSPPSNGQAARFDRPPVHVSKNGVHSVNPADILRSSVGQAEIRKAADAARSWPANGTNGKK